MQAWLSFILVLSVAAPAAAQTMAVDPALAVDPAPAPIADANEDEGLSVYVRASLGVDVVDLSGEALGFGDPEIAALRGRALPQGWLAGAGLGETGIADVSLSFGMRGFEFLRGPEVRLSYGGGGGDGEDYQPSGIEGLEIAAGSVQRLRAGIAVGVQLPIGCFVPYLLGRAGVGVAFVDVAVRDPRLGALGTETLSRTVVDLGIEGGVGFSPKPGVEYALAVRTSFLGVQGVGGELTVLLAPGEW